MKLWLSLASGVALAFLLSISGCGVGQFTAKTVATYETPDGKKISYESNKEQIGLEATFDPKTGMFHIKVDKAGTPEASIAAALENSKEALGLARDAMAIGKAVATKGVAP